MKSAALILSILLVNVPAHSAIAKIGTKIDGYFIDKNKLVKAEVVITKASNDNPNDEYTPAECRVQLPDTSFNQIGNIVSCDTILINEGDLNDDGIDELSVYSAPLHGCTYNMSTFSFKDGVFQEIIPMFLVQTACEPLSSLELKKLVFKENNLVFYMTTDPNDDIDKLIKNKVSIK
ncbi:hypothetical protein [Plesiomonas shigelloides]|uniref:hypothetical protein n=1 Tax=Plesiomonas shigelloides TaxID=703 RepID=UPI001C5ABCDD|nr:hypothetical protein [Plesiomonas shigelloides]MBW3794634.1 hypothetical protein [Plesiomonas shigelloides]